MPKRMFYQTQSKCVSVGGSKLDILCHCGQMFILPCHKFAAPLANLSQLMITCCLFWFALLNQTAFRLFYMARNPGGPRWESLDQVLFSGYLKKFWPKSMAPRVVHRLWIKCGKQNCSSQTEKAVYRYHSSLMLHVQRYTVLFQNMNNVFDESRIVVLYANNINMM